MKKRKKSSNNKKPNKPNNNKPRTHKITNKDALALFSE
jgi:hypothetical protein